MRAVQPSESSIVLSAPLLRSSATALGCRNMAAKCRGVRPSLVRALASAPLSTRTWMKARLPNDAARWRAVKWRRLVSILTSAPLSNRRCTVDAESIPVLMIRGQSPSVVCTLGSAPRSRSHFMASTCPYRVAMYRGVSLLVSQPRLMSAWHSSSRSMTWTFPSRAAVAIRVCPDLTVASGSTFLGLMPLPPNSLFRAGVLLTSSCRPGMKAESRATSTGVSPLLSAMWQSAPLSRSIRTRGRL
mmetsp:Transcript_3709/g.6557  ORF Transcript_3709/g.6557 Transcript_3709/m.6557 type:complete len:244 (-) Transcript_3709:3645-4376(-)